MKGIALNFNVPDDLDCPSEVKAAINQLLLDALMHYRLHRRLTDTEIALSNALLQMEDAPTTAGYVKIVFRPYLAGTADITNKIRVIKDLRLYLGIGLREGKDISESGIVHVPPYLVDTICMVVGGTYDVDESDLVHIHFQSSEDKIDAIKQLRALTRNAVPGGVLGLREAKEAVERGSVAVWKAQVPEVLAHLQGYFTKVSVVS